MKLKITDLERLAKFKCQRKDCPNKASAIFENKYICQECDRKINPKPNDRRVHCIRYLPQKR